VPITHSLVDIAIIGVRVHAIPHTHGAEGRALQLLLREECRTSGFVRALQGGNGALDGLLQVCAHGPGAGGGG